MFVKFSDLMHGTVLTLNIFTLKILKDKTIELMAIFLQCQWILLPGPTQNLKLSVSDKREFTYSCKQACSNLPECYLKIFK